MAGLAARAHLCVVARSQQLVASCSTASRETIRSSSDIEPQPELVIVAHMLRPTTWVLRNTPTLNRHNEHLR